MTLVEWALWGLAGAVCYAAPRLIVALSEAKLTASGYARPFAELLTAMGTGAAFGVALGPFVVDFLHLSKGSEQRAVSFMTGLVANPIAPLVVSIVSENILRRLGAPLETKTK